MAETPTRRVLVVDDNEDIHEDFAKILGGGSSASSSSLESARSAFLGVAAETDDGPEFVLGRGDQGLEGIEELQRAHDAGEPYAVAFVDVRMPPGIDGIETIHRMWEVEEDLQVVICTAFADYTFEEIIEKLGSSDRLLILKKPFDPVEVRQLAYALTEKWEGLQRERARVAEIERAGDEARVRAAELEAANQALEEANLRALAANEAKSNFLANMSHEIRTPMNAILGYVDLLCDPDVPGEEQRKYADIIRQSGEHLLTVLNDVLDISKIEAGRMTQQAVEVSAFELARDVVTLMQSAAMEKDLELVLEIPEAVPTHFESDPIRVRQVLLNLIGNSIKFTSQGTVRLRIGYDATAPPEARQLSFGVVDTGVGIESENLAHIFDAFSQVDSSSTRTKGGTGLGLAISKRLAQMLGGDIDVESTPGEGSTFTLRLPVDVGHQDELVRYEESDLALEATRKERRDGGEGFTGRVLLVEDVPFNQFLLSTMLKKAGAEVVVADNGKEGVDAALAARDEGRPFDIVLMDMQMPVMDGYEASRCLRDEGYPAPIIALTAHAMAGDRQKCLDAGCTDYTTKPIDRRLLLEMCRNLTSGEPQPEPPAPLPKGRVEVVEPEDAADV
jgi:signal transduction histidine kinase